MVNNFVIILASVVVPFGIGMNNDKVNTNNKNLLMIVIFESNLFSKYLIND